MRGQLRSGVLYRYVRTEYGTRCIVRWLHGQTLNGMTWWMDILILFVPDRIDCIVLYCISLYFTALQHTYSMDDRERYRSTSI